jgi:hypothetical protein
MTRKQNLERLAIAAFGTLEQAIGRVGRNAGV